MESAGAVALAASGALGEFGFGWNISPRVVDDDTPRDAAGCAATGVWRAGADARSNGRTVPAAQPAPRTSGGESPGRTKALLLLSVLSKSSRYGIAGMRSNGPGIGPSFRVVDASARVTGGSLRTGPISEEGDRPAGYAAVAWDGPGRPAVSPSPGSAGDVCAGEARPRRDEECANRHQRASSRRVAGVDRLLEQVAQYGATRHRGQAQFSRPLAAHSVCRTPASLSSRCSCGPRPPSIASRAPPFRHSGSTVFPIPPSSRNASPPYMATT